MNLKYEAVFIIKIDDEDKIKEVKDRIDNIFESEGMNVFKKEDFGDKKLAYEIKKQSSGRYYLINYEVPEGKENREGKFKIKLNTMEEVLKFIIVRMNEE